MTLTGVINAIHDDITNTAVVISARAEALADVCARAQVNIL